MDTGVLCTAEAPVGEACAEAPAVPCLHNDEEKQQCKNLQITHQLIGGSNNSQVFAVMQTSTSGQSIPLHEVLKVVPHTNNTAAKVAHARECAHLLNEFRILRSLLAEEKLAAHYFVQAHEHFQLQAYCAMSLEQANCDLVQFIDAKHCPFEVGSEEYFQAVRGLFKQVICALVHLHARHIAHNDIKPPNILVFEVKGKAADFGQEEDGKIGSSDKSSVVSITVCKDGVQQQVSLRAKLADFGFAAAENQQVQEQQNRWERRVRKAMAPEVLLLQQNVASSNKSACLHFDEMRADIFCAGMALFECMLRMSCYSGDCASADDLRFAPFYRAQKLDFWRQPDIMQVLPYLKARKEARLPYFMDLVSKMLEVDPTRRYTAQECLQHPFFK